MNKFNIKFNDVDTIGTIVHIAIDGQYKGNIVISLNFILNLFINL